MFIIEKFFIVPANYYKKEINKICQYTCDLDNIFEVE